MRQRLCMALVAAFLMVSQVGAQQITGTVRDQRNGQAMAAVQVFIQGSGIGALTQQNGRYLLLNVPVGTHRVTAQRIGFTSVTQSVTVTAGQTAALDFAMSEEALGLEEIIVTGTPGGTQRRAIGNSVLSVSAAEVTESAVMQDMKSLLRGRAPGVTLGSAAGNIGQGADITIRGTGSFNRERSNPIVFVDGVRVNTQYAGPQMAQGNRTSNPLDDFNPADIESIEIIKGPAAATLYGTEASAGVIQIITKRGRDGAPQFNASLAMGRIFTRAPHDKLGWMWACTNSATVPCRQGSTGPHLPEKVVPYSYIHLMNYALREGGFNVEWDRDHWPQNNLFQYGPSHSFNLDVRGGTDRVRYFLSANNDRDEGPVYFNWDDVMRMRGNVGVVFSEQFTLDVSTGFVSGETSFSGQAGTRGGVWDQMVWGQGYFAPTIDETGKNPAPRTLGMQQFLPTDIAKISSTREYDRFTGSATLNFTPGEWLSSRAIVGIDKSWDKNEWIHPIEVAQTNVIQEMLEGEILLEKPTNTDVSLDWSATVNQPFGSFTTATSVGAQYYSKTYELFGSVGKKFASPLSRTINQTPITSASITYRYEENKSLGFYAQEQLGWNDRVFITGAVRFDDNSAFGSGFDPILYPKVSGSWVVSEEPFWTLGFINEMRVRGAWGKAGRQPNTFDAVNTFASVAGPGGTSAVNPDNTGNVDVGPETSTELELGFDIAMLESRVTGEFNWYNRRNEDNLLGVSLPPSMGGGGAVQRNIGVIENWGWEAALNTRVYESPEISFSLDLTGAYKMNEITDIGEFPGNNTVKIGLPYPNGRSAQYWVMRAEYSPTGSITDPYNRLIQAYCDKGILLDPDPKANPRTSKYGVTTGGEIVPCQQVGGYQIHSGPAFTPWTWTVNPTLSLAQGMLTIRTMFDAAYGAIGHDDMKLWHHRYNTAWGSVTMNDPRYVAGYRLERWSSMGHYKKDYWKLREVGVRYQFPDGWPQRFGASRAALSFSGRELALLWSSDEGTGIFPSMKDLNHPVSTILDPDYGRSADGDGGHRADPPSTSFHIRLDVTF
jgi:TonB-dependent starch-binding outer membrane protein SusC